MTSLQIAVAKAMGWRRDDENAVYNLVWIRDGFHGRWTNLPPLTLDLMWDLVNSMTDVEKHAYAVLLAGDLWKPETAQGWTDWRDTLKVSEATIEQRAKAWLKVKGIEV